MALLPPLHSSFTSNNPHLLPYRPLPSTLTRPKLTIISQDSSSQSPKPTITNDPVPADKKPNSSTGQGFGSAQQPKPNASSTEKNKKGGRDRGRIIRRTPVARPAFLDKKGGVENNSEERPLNEKAFLLAWLGLGGLIFVEGIALAASGFLPEEWDKLFVKFLYPSFTPTVFLFVAVSVVYGVIKYFENENVRNQK